MPTAFKVYIGGNVVLIAAGIILIAVGLGDFAAFAVPMGTLLWMGATVAWIVFYDSKKRWPHLKAFDRYTKVVTFDH